MSTRPNVLLVDDRPDNLLALEAQLRPLEAQFLKAGSGREALDLLLQHEVAVAIVDVQMPEMDGFELAEVMRSSPRTKTIPIIFVTAGLHDRSKVFKGYEAGAVDFLIKPVEPRMLASKVEIFLQLHRHIQDLKAAQEALSEADQRKTEFLAVLSHELRNPLAPIKNSLYILDRAAPGGEQANRAKEIIARQVEQLANLVNDLLDVTRITRNKVRLHKETLEINEIVRRTAEDNRSLFERNHVELSIALSPDPIMVKADRTRLAQVISNLLQNAAKFTPTGGHTRIAVTSADESAIVRVTDDGVGMAPLTLGRLFQPFAQAAQAIDRSGGGLGLGLALVKGLVELHGGRVRAHSEGLGKGSEFVLEIPFHDEAALPMTPVAVHTTRQPRRILIIEDNRDAAESLREVLEFENHQVAVAHDGIQGLRMALEFRPEVVLCDIGLPGMDGYEVARALRADEHLRHVHLVALTGYALPEDLLRAREAGFQEHLAKPPSIERLAEILSRVPSSGADRNHAG